jgi:uncharacterized integral membrane protein
MTYEQRDSGDGGGRVPRGRAFPAWLIVTLVVVVVSLLFISRNRRRVKVNFVVFDRQARLWVVILIAMALGALIAEALHLAVRRRRASKS